MFSIFSGILNSQEVRYWNVIRFFGAEEIDRRSVGTFLASNALCISFREAPEGYFSWWLAQ